MPDKALCRACGNAFRPSLLRPQVDGCPAVVCTICQQKHAGEVGRLEALVRSAENAARAARLQVEIESRKAVAWDREAAQHRALLTDFLRTDAAASDESR